MASHGACPKVCSCWCLTLADNQALPSPHMVPNIRNIRHQATLLVFSHQVTFQPTQGLLQGGRGVLSSTVHGCLPDNRVLWNPVPAPQAGPSLPLGTPPLHGAAAVLGTVMTIISGLMPRAEVGPTNASWTSTHSSDNDHGPHQKYGVSLLAKPLCLPPPHDESCPLCQDFGAERKRK